MKNDRDKEEHTSQLSYEKSGGHCNAAASAQTAQEFCDALCSLEDFRTDERKEEILGQGSVCERKDCVHLLVFQGITIFFPSLRAF